MTNISMTKWLSRMLKQETKSKPLTKKPEGLFGVKSKASPLWARSRFSNSPPLAAKPFAPQRSIRILSEKQKRKRQRKEWVYLLTAPISIIRANRQGGSLTF